jgi:hypothetical protein
MVKNLYEHFVVLYEAILPANPTLASEHALRQEVEVYNKSNKITYRNVHFVYHLSQIILTFAAGSNKLYRIPEETPEA